MRPTPLLFALFVLGCSSQGAEYAGEIPESGTLRLHGVTVAPCKYGGAAWDGPGQLAPDEVGVLGTLLKGRVPYVEFAKALATPAAQALDKPEVQGDARLLRPSEEVPTMLTAQEDTFTPQFAPTPTWQRVPFDGSVRLAVNLVDDDIVGVDPVGTFQIGPDDMIEALRAGNVHQVRVDGQTNQQVLFAAISVMVE
jgi:hypothetical protein